MYAVITQFINDSFCKYSFQTKASAVLLTFPNSTLVKKMTMAIFPYKHKCSHLLQSLKQMNKFINQNSAICMNTHNTPSR